MLQKDLDPLGDLVYKGWFGRHLMPAGLKKIMEEHGDVTDDMVTVMFQPDGISGVVESGITIVEAARMLGADIEALCGGKAVCGKCMVRIVLGEFQSLRLTSSAYNVSPWETVESKFITPRRRAEGYRLGCVARLLDDLVVFVPEESRAGKPVVSKAARDIPLEWRPAVRLYTVTVEQPTCQDPTADFERISAALFREHGLDGLTIDLVALRELATVLREGNWCITVSVWMAREIIRVRPGKAETTYGLAIDVGTTTLAGYLCDLTTTEVVTADSMMNPQHKYGEDVMSRITYHTQTPYGLKRMSDDIIEGVNTLIDRLIAHTYPPRGNPVMEADMVEAADAGERSLCLTRGDIEDIAIGLNTAMHHILLGLTPAHLGVSPFPPVIHHSLDIRARDLEIRVNPSARVFMLPNEAGFVGADNVGVLICEEPYKSDDYQLIIDIGTNGEIFLGNRHRLISASCATGPALEGAQITWGMRAAPGAIEQVRIEPETFEVDYKVIGRDAWRSFSDPSEMKARGICGSGILDLLAEMYQAGVITRTGAFNKQALAGHPRYRVNPDNGGVELVLAFSPETRNGYDIVITQKDVRQIQLAKAALYAGCKILLNRMGLEKPDRIKIAGSFGTHVDRERAMMIGLFPACEIDKIESIGNAAGDGCRAALLNINKRIEAEWVSRNVEYIELTGEPTFQDELVGAIHLPPLAEW